MIIWMSSRFVFNRLRSKSRGRLFFRLVQQAVAVEPVPLDGILHPEATAKAKPQRWGYLSEADTPQKGILRRKKPSLRPGAKKECIMSQNNGNSLRLKTGLAEMLKGGVIMDVTNADQAHHVDKHAFSVPFVCGARNLGEALRRIAEGAAMIRTKGEAGTGDVVHAVKHMRQIMSEMHELTVLREEELYARAKDLQAPYELVRLVAKEGKLPVPNFSAGGIATTADASLVMQLGAESVFVGSGIFMKDSTTFADPAD